MLGGRCSSCGVAMFSTRIREWPRVVEFPIGYRTVAPTSRPMRQYPDTLPGRRSRPRRNSRSAMCMCKAVFAVQESMRLVLSCATTCCCMLHVSLTKLLRFHHRERAERVVTLNPTRKAGLAYSCNILLSRPGSRLLMIYSLCEDTT